MGIQIFNLVQKNNYYAAQEASLQKDKEILEDQHEELEQYEQYTQTREYKENVARKKLGMLYPNEQIFRAKSDN